MGLHKATTDSFLSGWCWEESLVGCSRRHQLVWKKLRLIRILGLFICITAISTFSFSISAFFKVESHSTDPITAVRSQKSMHWHQRTLLAFEEQNQNDMSNLSVPKQNEIEDHSTSNHSHNDYPEDIFSLEDRRRGAVILHIIGMIYMFIALAIVCDEFFVPSLTIITEKLVISDDVAGATFMAAGGSAPELFTSLIGVFISHTNVGIGTIVGSAVFNILFVIGMCAMFSKQVLNLTWWPLFRDVSFYVVDLILLIIFFLDNIIEWWESVLLLSAYGSYVIFMKYNVQVEDWVKRKCNRNKVVKVTAADPERKDQQEQPNILVLREEQRGQRPLQEQESMAMKPRHMIKAESTELKESWNDSAGTSIKSRPRLQRGGSSASLHNSLMRNSIFQLMIHTLDPLSEAVDMNDVEEVEDPGEETEMTREDREEQKPETGTNKSRKVKWPDGKELGAYGKLKYYDTMTEEGKFREKASILNKMAKKKRQVEDSERLNGAANYIEKDELPNTSNVEVDVMPKGSAVQNGNLTHSIEGSDTQIVEANAQDDQEDQPLSLAWPATYRKRLVYLAVLPIIFPLWATLPDVRNPSSRKFFPITFFGSIAWIAAFSYLMVWWAHQVGETIGITEEVMGLTILAAGTSIPDLITSVIVARKGLGDMAVSSSVGSNIFDITVGLPLPWLLKTLSKNIEPVAVSSNGLFCAIVLLFFMLLFVIISIAGCRWRMNKVLGCAMFLLYFVFLVLSVLLENRIIMCPIST